MLSLLSFQVERCVLSWYEIYVYIHIRRNRQQTDMQTENAKIVLYILIPYLTKHITFNMIWYVVYVIWYYMYIIWCDIWHDMIYDMTCHDMTWRNWRGETWHDMVYGVLWRDVMWYDIWYMIWYMTFDVMWCGVVWCDMICSFLHACDVVLKLLIIPMYCPNLIH